MVLNWSDIFIDFRPSPSPAKITLHAVSKRLRIDNAEPFITTPQHRIVTSDGGHKKATELPLGSHVMCSDGVEKMVIGKNERLAAGSKWSSVHFRFHHIFDMFLVLGGVGWELEGSFAWLLSMNNLVVSLYAFRLFVDFVDVGRVPQSKHVPNMFRNKSLVLLTYPDHKSKPRSRSKRFWPLPSSRTSRWLASHHPRSPLCCPWASPWNPPAAVARIAASAGDLKKVRMWVCLTQLQVNTRIK